jgi:hypothetical protein
MDLFIGFTVGMTFGCYLWWQTLLQGNELYQEHMKVLRELQQARRQIYDVCGSRFVEDGPTTRPSRN